MLERSTKHWLPLSAHRRLMGKPIGEVGDCLHIACLFSSIPMFQSAATNHFAWQCDVGGGSKTDHGGLSGNGCMLDNIHVLTARHVWTSICHKYEWPVALRQDGLFRCEVAFESPEHDIMVLRTVAPMSDPTGTPPPTYPKLSTDKMFLGSFVGFISRLQLGTAEQAESLPHFAFAVVSVLPAPQNGRVFQFALSSTVMQFGFSGSAVFRQDGSIVGVLTSNLRFCADLHDSTAPVYSLPCVSPIFPLVQQLESIIKPGIDSETP